MRFTLAYLRLAAVFFLSLLFFQSSAQPSVSEDQQALSYFNSELEKIDKEIRSAQTEYEINPTHALLAALNEKKLKREVLNVFGSKAAKQTTSLLKNFAYFSACEAFLIKQKELEEKYDLRINLNVEKETREKTGGLGTRIMSLFTRNENSALNRLVDVNLVASPDLNSLEYLVSFSSPLQEELSSKEAFAKQTFALSDITAGSLATTKFMDALENYLSVLVLRIDEKNISDLWELRNADSTITFMTPAGAPFTLPLKDLSSLSFSYNDEDIELKKCNFFADGSLQTFTYKQVKYFSCRLANHRENFTGYFSSDGSQCITAKRDSLSFRCPQKTHVVVAYACITNDKLQFKACKVPVLSSVVWPAGAHKGNGTYKAILPIQYEALNQTGVTLSGASALPRYSEDSKKFLRAMNICDRDYTPYAITVANIITKYPAVISQCYGLQRLIDDFDLTRHLQSAANSSSPLTAYQDKVAALMARALELQGYAGQSKYSDYLTAHLSTGTQVSSFVLDNRNFCLINFLRAPERLRLIRVLLEKASREEQEAIVVLFKTLNPEISDEDFISFFNGLSAPAGTSSPVSTITDVYRKVTTGDYTDLNKTLCEKFAQRSGVLEHFFPGSEDKRFEHILYYDQTITSSNAPVGTHNYNVELLDDGRLEVKTKYVQNYQNYQVNTAEGTDQRYEPLWVSGPTATLNPFSVITFVNHSGLSSLEELGREDDILVAPAIFLKFADDKTFNANAFKTAALVLDALVVSVGPRLVIEAYRLGRMGLAIYEGTQVMASLAHISVTSLKETDPMRQWVEEFYLVVAGWGFGRIFTNPKLYTGAYYASVKANLFNGLNRVRLQNLVKQYDQLKTKLKGHINNTSVSKELEKVMEYLRGMVEGGNYKPFIAKTAVELNIHLSSLPSPPPGASYTGELYRSLNLTSELNYGATPTLMNDHLIYSSWGRYDLNGAENAMYFSKTIMGNKTEIVPHYGVWEAFSTYKFSSIQIDNLLDLTNEAIRLKLGVEYEQLVKVLDNKSEMYEFTNELASWARQKGYNGLIVPGARGDKNYENIILFTQEYVTQITSGKTITKIAKP